MRFPDQRLSVVVLANVTTVPAQGLAFQVAELYLADALATEPAAISVRSKGSWLISWKKP